jgi:hypothetical protein
MHVLAGRGQRLIVCHLDHALRADADRTRLSNRLRKKPLRPAARRI